MCYHEGSWSVPSNNRGTWDEKTRDMDRVDGWLKDFHNAEEAGELPQFTIMALPENHTHGTTPDAFTPEACVASNDIGVGKIVEAATKSKFWKEMAIFIVEDDAQDGPDHVDSHRTVALVISPYTRRGLVDSMSVAVFHGLEATYELSLAELEAWSNRPAQPATAKPKSEPDRQLALIGVVPPARQGSLF